MGIRLYVGQDDSADSYVRHLNQEINLPFIAPRRRMGIRLYVGQVMPRMPMSAIEIMK